MATITVPDSTFERLSRRAEALGTTVEALALPALEWATLAPGESPAQSDIPPPLPYDEWKKRFDELTAHVQGRAHLYPPGFRVDDSRESIYEGCGE